VTFDQATSSAIISYLTTGMGITSKWARSPCFTLGGCECPLNPDILILPPSCSASTPCLKRQLNMDPTNSGAGRDNSRAYSANLEALNQQRNPAKRAEARATLEPVGCTTFLIIRHQARRVQIQGIESCEHGSQNGETGGASFCSKRSNGRR